MRTSSLTNWDTVSRHDEGLMLFCLLCCVCLFFLFEKKIIIFFYVGKIVMVHSVYVCMCTGLYIIYIYTSTIYPALPGI